MKKNVLILAAALALVACGGNAQRKTAASDSQTTTTAAPDMHTAETSLDYLGTYDLHMKYIDRDSEFDEKGAFSVKENLLTLTQLDDGSEEYYKVEENRLRMLDAEKQPVTGALAENYILQKTK